MAVGPMSVKRRGLGRGLDALLGGTSTEDANEAEEAAAPAGAVQEIAVDLIQRGRFQPRRHFDPEKLQELADSIAAQGVVQPVVVRPLGDGRYELIAGERRWRASQQAGLHQIPVVVRDVDDRAAMALGLIENIQRDDLNPLEEAGALSRLLNDFGLTHQEVAQAVGKSRTTVTNLLRLLDLNDDVKALVEQGALEMGHARALLGLKGSAQSETARKVVHNGLSVRETEREVRRQQSRPETASADSKPGAAAVDPDVRRLLDDLTQRLGARVELKPGTKGSGRLIIAYNSLDELEGILEHIQ